MQDKQQRWEEIKTFLLNNKHLKYNHICDKIGLDKAFFTRIMNGKCRMPDDFISKIEKELLKIKKELDLLLK